jgi:hypothetical protein
MAARTGGEMYEVTVKIIRNNEILEEDVATGNTKRTAFAAGHALGRTVAGFYEGAHYVVSDAVTSEIRS